MTTLHLRNSISRSPLRRGFVLIPLALTLVWFALSPTARATTTTWTYNGTSDWFTGANWSNGVPDCTKDASVNNAGQAQITSSGATALSLTLGENTTNSGKVEVDGGTLLVQGCPSAPVRGPITVGYQGTGALSISNGGLVQSGSGYIAASTSSSAASKGSVTVAGSGSTWQVGDLATIHSVLFVGGNENSDGGTALLSITNGGSVLVQNIGYDNAATVGPSGTLTGNGTLDTTNSNTPLTDVKGTLSPSWTLSIGGNLTLESSAATVCDVIPQNLGSVDVSVSGAATLNGRLLVTMTGTFTAGTQFTLLHSAGGITPNTTFSSASIKYPTNQGFTPQIIYDYVGNNVYLNLETNH